MSSGVKLFLVCFLVYVYVHILWNLLSSGVKLFIVCFLVNVCVHILLNLLSSGVKLFIVCFLVNVCVHILLNLLSSGVKSLIVCFLVNVCVHILWNLLSSGVKSLIVCFLDNVCVHILWNLLSSGVKSLIVCFLVSPCFPRAAIAEWGLALNLVIYPCSEIHSNCFSHPFIFPNWFGNVFNSCQNSSIVLTLSFLGIISFKELPFLLIWLLAVAYWSFKLKQIFDESHIHCRCSWFQPGNQSGTGRIVKSSK